MTSKINNENHITIHGWMINELNLKGNDLLIYAIIYGFSQDGQSKFTGSLQYLADWTNSTKQGCIKNLKNLCEQGLIIKSEYEINNIKLCDYSINMNRVHTIKQSLIPIKQSLINNNINNNIIDINNIDLIENNKIINKDNNVEKEKTSDDIKHIIDYLNEKINTNYRYNSKGTVNLIKARLKDGYTINDFYNVIDKKVNEWKNTEFEQYLRPSTLFGNKFENYLNQKSFKGNITSSYSSKKSFDNTIGHTKIYHISDEDFNNLTYEEKLKEIEKYDAVADMTPLQKEFHNKYCLARDENGNLLKF